MRRSAICLLGAASAREILGLHPSTPYSAKEIKEAYYTKAKEAHPDVGGNAEQFKQLQGAYERLMHSSGERPSDSEAGTSSHSSEPGGEHRAHGGGDFDTGRADFAQREPRPESGGRSQFIFYQVLYIVVKKVCLLVMVTYLYCVVVFGQRGKPRDPSAYGTNQDPSVVFERQKRDYVLRQMKPQMSETWTEEQKQTYMRRWNSNFSQRRVAATRLAS